MRFKERLRLRFSQRRRTDTFRRASTTSCQRPRGIAIASSGPPARPRTRTVRIYSSYNIGRIFKTGPGAVDKNDTSLIQKRRKKISNSCSLAKFIQLICERLYKFESLTIHRQGSPGRLMPKLGNRPEILYAAVVLKKPQQISPRQCLGGRGSAFGDQGSQIRMRGMERERCLLDNHCFWIPFPKLMVLND
jgi:hypothetical protein